VVPLGPEPILLGRGADATIRLDDDYVSTRHARFVPHGDEWYIEDLGSTNGTYIGSQRITTPMVVSIGVQVRLGKTIAELKK
jgi:pSer/pThr/pTyr-binding forkhead associated (FHA) protein